MKIAILFSLILSSFSLIAQSPKEEISQLSIKFNAYEKFKAQDHAEMVRQFNAFAKQIGYKKRDSLYYIFLNEELQVNLAANKIDFSRISQHPDSLKITEDGIIAILKPKKK